MKKVIVGMMIAAMAVLSLSADIYVKSKTHTDAMQMMGQTTPASDSVSETWIGDNALAMIGANNITIIDLGKSTFTMANTKAKTYVETPLPIDFAKLLPPQMASMASMMIMSATVTETSETKTIGAWKCKGYDMTMTIMGMPMKTRVWATTDVPFDAAKFAEKFMPAMTKGMMRLDDNSIKEMMKIKGYQIATETNAEMMGAKIHTTSEVVEITKKSAPAGTYAVPAGFTKKDTLDMSEMQNR
jgi:hypothetical protein